MQNCELIRALAPILQGPDLMPTYFGLYVAVPKSVICQELSVSRVNEKLLKYGKVVQIPLGL